LREEQHDNKSIGQSITVADESEQTAQSDKGGRDKQLHRK